MKKRLLAVLFAIVMAVGCVFVLAACKDDTNTQKPLVPNGTYNVYDDPSGPEGTVEINNGNFVLSDAYSTYSATFEVNGNKLKLISEDEELNGAEMEIISEGVIKSPRGGLFGKVVYIVLEGKTPPTDDESWN